MTELIDKLVSFDVAPEGLVIKHTQDIPDEHIAKLKRDKIDADHTPTRDFLRFASIPISVLELWDKQGWRLEEHTAHEIVQKLHADGLDAFITTRKQI